MDSGKDLSLYNTSKKLKTTSQDEIKNCKVIYRANNHITSFQVLDDGLIIIAESEIKSEDNKELFDVANDD